MEQRNAAQQIHQYLGVPINSAPKQAHGSQNASPTKSGPGRFAIAGKSGSRTGKARPVRAYKALMNAWAEKRIVKWDGGRDKHGAYTLVGRGEMPNGETDGRRKWLAGISAQRGY